MYAFAIRWFLLGIVLTPLVVARDESVDKTTLARASGPDVVQAVVQRISDSRIFPSDNGILRRIAYVETKDGASPNTFRGGYYGGIWQVNQSRFLDTKNTASYPALSGMHASINMTFSIKWSLVTWKELEKPLYSGLAARLLLSIISRETIPFSIQAQADFWKKMYTAASGNGTAQQFIQDVFNLEESDKKCTSSISVDIVLVLDKSGSIGSSNFDLVRSLCINITKAFQIEKTGTRIGIIGFDSSVLLEFNLRQYNTTSAIINAINNIAYTAQSTRTDLALQALPSAFTEANGARPLSNGVPKIAVVITGRNSDNASATRSAAIALHSDPNTRHIDVYAVGVGRGVTYEELKTIASQDSKVMDLSSFSVDQFRDLQSSIIRDACKSSAVITINDTVLSSVTVNPKYYSIIINANKGITLFLKVISGAVKVYASAQISTPNSAFYSWMVSTDNVSNLFISFSSNTYLYFGIQGYHTADNAFEFSTTSGDASTPQPPRGPPQNLIVRSTSSKTVYVKWDPPLEYHQNGVIDKYLLRVIDTATGQTRIIYLSQVYYIVDGLYPDRTYSISVKAHNSDGFGPFSDSVVSKTTAAAGGEDNTENRPAAVGGAVGGIFTALIIVVIILCCIGAVIKCQTSKPKMQQVETTKICITAVVYQQ